MITADYLRKQRESMEAQQQSALATAEQASGAIALIDVLLGLFETKTLDDIKAATGADSIEIVEAPDAGE